MHENCRMDILNTVVSGIAIFWAGITLATVIFCQVTCLYFSAFNLQLQRKCGQINIACGLM